MPWFLALLACGPTDDPLPIAVVAPADFELRVTAHGELEARVNTFVSTPPFPSSMTVGWIVEEGTRVAVGDPVVEFETTELKSQLESARAGLETERTRIVQRRARLTLDEAQAKSSIDKIAIGLRLAQLRVTDSDTVSRIDREGALVDVERASLAVAKAERDLSTLRAEAAAEIELLEVAVADKERRLARMEEQLAQAVVVAPAEGLAITYRRVGSVCWPGSRLLTLPDLDTMQVVAWVPEVDAPHVHVGQRASVVLDAYPDAPIAGEVTRVADLPVTGGSEWDDDDEGQDEAKRLRVEVAITPPAPDPSRRIPMVLKPGMTVRADLLVEARPAALAVPLQAVQRDDTGPYVQVSGLGGWSRQPVTLGPENALRVVVEQGLEAGQTVALADPERWASGERPAALP